MTCQQCGTLNPAGMRYCGMCGRPMHAGTAGRERRRVSVVFIDLASFSDLTRNQDPEDLRDLADEVLTSVATVIEEYDGYVDAFRGDGLIALFGAPHSHPDDPERAVRAAAAGLRAIEAVGRYRGVSLKGRAGVNTGVVIAGAIGSGRVRDYTVMGSAVNLAARLEAAAGLGEVWVGPATFRAARHRLSFEPTGVLQIQGFPDVRRAFRLRAEDAPLGTDPYAHLTFVGRERERAWLRTARDRVVSERSAHELWVVGEAGSGKSRLLREAFGRTVWDAPDPSPDRVLWLRMPVTGSELPWSRLAAAMFGLDEGAKSPAVYARLERTLNELLPNEPRWRREILASLNLIENRPWRRLDRRQGDRTSLAWRDLLASHANQSDGAWVLIVDDDPHDPTFDEFLKLVRQAEAPILTVRAGRGRNVPTDSERMRLPPLDTEESMTLVTQLVPPPMHESARTLVPQLGGTPAHLIELGRALAAHETGGAAMSLAFLLQARLDRLDPSARKLLAYAALVGERMWDGLLETLSPAPYAALVDALVREKLLVPAPESTLPDQREYRFQSELLRRAVMRMIPFSDRPQMHLRIGSWLEAHAPLHFSEAIGEQFRHGGAAEAAYAHWMAATDLYQQQGEPERADALYEKLLALDVSEELKAQAALSWAQNALDVADPDAAAARLTRTDAFIGACPADVSERLQVVRDQLVQELDRLRASLRADPHRDTSLHTSSESA